MTQKTHISAKDAAGRIFGAGGDTYAEMAQNLADFMGGAEAAEEVLEAGRAAFRADPTLNNAIRNAQRGLGATYGADGGQRPQRGRPGAQGGSPPPLSGVTCKHGIPARLVEGKFGSFATCGLPYKDPNACDFKQDMPDG